MSIYKSEVLYTTFKWFRDSANEKDLKILNELINKRASEGWIFVSHSYMVNAFSSRSAFLLTSKNENQHI